LWFVIAARVKEGSPQTAHRSRRDVVTRFPAATQHGAATPISLLGGATDSCRWPNLSPSSRRIVETVPHQSTVERGRATVVTEACHFRRTPLH